MGQRVRVRSAEWLLHGQQAADRAVEAAQQREAVARQALEVATTQATAAAGHATAARALRWARRCG